MAFGDGQPQEVNAGIAAQPLVTSPDRSITSQSAVDQMAQAFRDGFITTQDIQRNIGMSGPRKKAELQQISEYTNPDVIQSRLNVAGAQGAQANLLRSQALAEMPLVGQSAAMRAKQMEREQANIWDAESLKMYQEMGNPKIYKSDGSEDAEKMSYRGRFLLLAKNKRDYAQSMLTGKPTKQVRNGVEHNIMANILGQDVTRTYDANGKPNNKFVEHYEQMVREAQKDLYESHWEPKDQEVGRPLDAEGKPVINPSPVAAPVVLPTSTNSNPAIDAPLQPGMPIPIPGFSPDQRAAAAKKVEISPDGTVTTTTAPTATAAPWGNGTGTGFASGTPGNYNIPKEISDAKDAAPELVEWNKMKEVVGRFKSVSALPPSVTTDKDLLQTVAALRGNPMMDSDKLNRDMPFLAKVKNLKSILAGEAMIPDEDVRNRVRAEGMRAIQARDTSVRSALTLAKNRWDVMNKDLGYVRPYNTLFNPDEEALLNGGSSMNPSQQRALPPGARAEMMGGRDGYVKTGPDGKEYFYAYTSP
jgi:hypothetical protein